MIVENAEEITIPQIEITDNQIAAIRVLKLDDSQLLEIVQSLFDSKIRSAIKAKLEKKVMAKHIAISAGKHKTAEILSVDIADLEAVLETIAK